MIPWTMIRTISSSLLLLIIFLLVPAGATATPNPSEWRQVNVLGANDTHYFLIAVERSLPGSYYLFTDRWYLEKRRLGDRKLIQRDLLREASYMDDAVTPKVHWEITKDKPMAFDLTALLAKEKVMAPFPKRLPGGLKVEQKNTILTLIIGDYRQDLAGGIKFRPDDHAKLRIRGFYRTANWYFLVVEQGEPDDVGYLQVVVPLSEGYYRTVRKLHRMWKYPVPPRK